MTPILSASASGPATAGPAPLDRAVAACRRAFVTVAAFSFAINLLVLVVPLYMVQVFDRVLTSRSADSLWVLTVAAILAFVVMAGLDVIRSRILVRVGLWLDSTLAPPLLRAALDPAGSAQAPQALRDLGQVRAFLSGSGVMALLDAPWVPLFVGLVFILHPVLGVAALIGAVLLFAIGWMNEIATRSPLNAANGLHAECMAAADALARQAAAVKGLGMASAVVDRWTAASGRALTDQAQASDRAGLFSALSRFVRLTLQVAMIGLAALFVIHQELTAGAMIAASIMLARALAPVEQAIGTWRNVVGARAAFARVRDALNETVDAAPRMQLPTPQGRVAVERLTFAPVGVDRAVFKMLSFAVNPGEILGISGPSGAGKSSLVRMLLGARAPHAGCVRLDGAVITDWPGDMVGRHIGYVPQSVELLPGTVAENIARFSDAPADRVVAAAQAAGIHDLVLALPQGYDTMIGGADDLLSAGARQRVALARALFGDPVLLILDEPYSNLDAPGVEALVRAMVAAKQRGATVMIVAHRPSILAHTDRVLYLDGGVGRLVKAPAQAALRVVNPAAEDTKPPAPTEKTATSPEKTTAPPEKTTAPARKPRRRKTGEAK